MNTNQVWARVDVHAFGVVNFKNDCAESAFLNPGPDLILESRKLQDHDFEIFEHCIVLHTCRTRAGSRHFRHFKL